MGGKELICRLCLNVLTDHLKKLKKFSEINSSEERMLKFVCLDLNMSVTENPIICLQCLKILHQSYNFKMVCQKTEDFLDSVYDRKKKTKLNLTYLFFSKNDYKNKCESEGVCRFCLGNLKSDSFMELGKLNEDIFLSDMINKCLPEFDLEITQQPAMCLECNEKLQTLFNFMMASQDNDEKIKKKVSFSGVDSRGFVSLRDVLKFVDDMNNGDVKPLEEENIMSIVKVETIEVGADDIQDTVPKVEVLDDEMGDEFEETKKGMSGNEFVSIKVETDDIRDTVPKVEVLDDEMGEEFEETKKGMSCHEILSTEEATRQFKEMKEDESNHEVLSKIKAKRQIEETKEDTNSYTILLEGKVKRVRILKTVESTNKKIRPIRKYPCRHCNVTVYSQTDLVNHLRSVHQDTCCLHRCDRCDFLTIFPAALQRHKSDCLHFLYQCDRCDYTSYKKHQWMEHRRIGCYAELKCAMCLKGFTRRVDLHGHVLAHHPEQEALVESLVMRKVYRCHACSFKTVFGSAWRKHKCQEIVSYYCEVCEFSTAFSVCLEKHKEVMHKYRCSVCEMNFAIESDCTTHMKGHTVGKGGEQ